MLTKECDKLGPKGRLFLRKKERAQFGEGETVTIWRVGSSFFLFSEQEWNRLFKKEFTGLDVSLKKDRRKNRSFAFLGLKKISKNDTIRVPFYLRKKTDPR